MSNPLASEWDTGDSLNFNPARSHIGTRCVRTSPLVAAAQLSESSMVTIADGIGVAPALLTHT